MPAYVFVATLSFLGLVLATIAWSVSRRRTSRQVDAETTTFQSGDNKTMNADSVRHYAAGFETKATAFKDGKNDVLDVIVILDATIVDNDQDKEKAVSAFNDAIV